MTKFIVASLAGLVAGLSAAPAAPAPRAAERVAVVVDASGPGARGARRRRARRTPSVRHATFRAPRTLHEQLSVTALLAAQGYTTIVGYGLEAPVAIAPLDGARPLRRRRLTPALAPAPPAR